MFERIEEVLKAIESTNEEIRILLNMANISFLDYISIKRGEMAVPENIGAWTLASLDQEVEKLNASISKLEKIKKEVLTW